MADVLLFHHCLGVTDGVNAFADRLRDAGHDVTVPDLYGGATFPSLDAGIAYSEDIGMEEIIERGARAAQDLPDRVVYAGFSLGSLPAQKLAQTRPGALGALLYHGGIPTSWFGDGWPQGVALQVHLMEGDEFCELDDAQALVRDAADAELFVYPGSAHLFADESFTDYDPEAAGLTLERTLAFLGRWPSTGAL